MADIDPADLPPREVYLLLTGVVVPRPIAWVSTLAADGTRNLAPHSFFSPVTNQPPIIQFTSTGTKDTLHNVRATREFVVNVVSRDLAEAMNVTAADFPAEEDEFAWAGLDAEPSHRVAPPRVARARAALECRLRTVVSMGTGNVVFGDVVHVHVDDEVWRDGGVDFGALEPLGRLAGISYTHIGPETVTSIPRRMWDDLRGHDERPPADRR